ncbi:hypothetical protein ACFLY6_00270 [Candidatus Dependentiae bacterium]
MKLNSMKKIALLLALSAPMATVFSEETDTAQSTGSVWKTWALRLAAKSALGTASGLVENKKENWNKILKKEKNKHWFSGFRCIDMATACAQFGLDEWFDQLETLNILPKSEKSDEKTEFFKELADSMLPVIIAHMVVHRDKINNFGAEKGTSLHLIKKLVVGVFAAKLLTKAKEAFAKDGSKMRKFLDKLTIIKALERIAPVIDKTPGKALNFGGFFGKEMGKMIAGGTFTLAGGESKNWFSEKKHRKVFAQKMIGLTLSPFCKSLNDGVEKLLTVKKN